MTKYSIFKTKWGYFGIAGNETGLMKTCLPTTFKKAKLLLLKELENAKYDKSHFGEFERLVTAYFEGCYVNFCEEIAVVPDGFTDFRKAVLSACRAVSFGDRISYGELAERIGRPNASRAVGRVLAKNPLPLIIPCHRIVCGNGGLGGFSAIGGVTFKKRMLELEKICNGSTSSPLKRPLKA
jgi:methylated-DNA-[protein]-cysteine S-methyltransferase